VRVVSYNLRDLLDDRAALTRVVHAVRPDVLCAQEVPRFWFARRRIQRLARELGLVPVCGGRGSGGTAVLVAPGVRVLAAQVLRLPVAHWWTRTRGAATAVVDAGEGPVRVVSVHLPLQPHLRVDHARRVVARLAHDVQPTVLAGDLNEPAEGAAWAVLQALAPVDVGAGRAEATFPARGPHRRIDAVLATPDLQVDGVQVGDQVAGVRRTDLEAATDHLPLVVDLHPSR
jgi:endonuclease/exonuclease/phosphatase family metal-dependent hydrolase